MAAQHAARIHRQHYQVIQQNARRRRMNRALLSRVVQEVVATPATVEDYQQLAEIVQEAKEQTLELDQVETRIRETTPFVGILQFLGNSENRTEVWTVLGIIVMILLHILNQQQPTKVEVVTPSVDEIVERIAEQMERDQPPEPLPTTEAECSQGDQEPRSKAR
jgi:hypothetical protein